MYEGFVDVSIAVEGVLVEPRYAGSENFIGRPIAGYLSEKIIVSREVASALAKVQSELSKHDMALKLYDGYRPQQAVNDFVRWALDAEETSNKSTYYPNIDKSELFERGYIARRSGHSRGGSVDLTIVEKSDDGKWREVDMGSRWDLFDTRSHGASTDVSRQAQKNRKFLSDVMVRHGFEPYAEEWWHFTLVPEPYPNTYFDFPIR